MEEVPKGTPGNYFLKWIEDILRPTGLLIPLGRKLSTAIHPNSLWYWLFSINDEWYYHMRFREAMKGVTPILSALPSVEPKEKTAPSNNPHVRKSVLESKEALYVAWVYQQMAITKTLFWLYG